ncbi:MAG: exodeoxyribonuclease VII large subunit [Phycisphaerae bacterium]|jgi:exodeoxyribonuclease VII large subunit
MASERPLFSQPSPVPPPAAGGPRLLTVSQLNALIQRVLGDHLPGTIHLVGQISNFTRHGSGHLYLTLKDDGGEIRAVMWKSAAAGLKFKPADGLEVVATGHVDVYAARGQYQFQIRRLEPRGVGALELAFRQLHEKLGREGLFDPARKKPIPRFPRTIAVVTSPTGAAIRDILHTLRRRFPCASVLLHPVRVQGEGAAADVAGAIARLNRLAGTLGGIDVMIVARGGGSIEDLWAFNEEPVARAIFASRIPVISGVGHEVDVTIADLVADLRAPTPTAAAELACPVLEEVLDLLAGLESRLRRAVRHRLDRERADLAAVERLEWLRDPRGLIRRAEQRLDEVMARLSLGCVRLLARYRELLNRSAVRLAARSPATILERARDALDHARRRLEWAVQHRVREVRRAVERLEERLGAARPAMKLSAEAQALASGYQRLLRAASHRLALQRQALDSFEARLEATSFRKTLARGFTITRLKRGRVIITRPDQVRPGDRVVTETLEGSFESRVQDPRQPELFD